MLDEGAVSGADPRNTSEERAADKVVPGYSMDETGFINLLRTFPDAVLGGIVIAAACSLLGVFVILKRVVFIGVTLSEVAACGIAAALMCGVHPFLGASVFALAAVTVLAQPFELKRLPETPFWAYFLCWQQVPASCSYHRAASACTRSKHCCMVI